MRQDDLFGTPPKPKPGDILPAITLWQPWASLLFTGHKVHETRSWEIPARLVGRRIAIHAAATFPAARHIGQPLQALADMVFKSDWRTTLPTGSILGTCILAGCVPTETLRNSITDDDHASGIWSDGRWAWIIDDIHAFAEPIPASGLQGIWNWALPLA